MHIKKARDKPSAATARHARDEIFIRTQTHTHRNTHALEYVQTLAECLACNGTQFFVTRIIIKSA